MKYDRSFFKCSICGNLVEMIENSGVNMRCCGKDMELLEINTVEASKEKHIPVWKITNGKLEVSVGSSPHPMTEEHHISFIVVAQNKRTQHHYLTHTEEAKAAFCILPEDASIYAYCNLHGLWASEVSAGDLNEELTCSAEFSDGCKSHS